MKYKLPKSFYLKLTFILVVLFFAYSSNQFFIEATLNNQDLSTSQQVRLILQQVMSEQKPDYPMEEEIYVEETTYPGNKIPNTIPETTQSHPRFEYSQEQANLFNQGVDMRLLNQYFLEKSNQVRQELDWEPMTIGWYLEEGSLARVQELSDYHYLSTETVDGQVFRSHFFEIDRADYRLGENLYELFISAGDIHLSTWQDEEILADYLFNIFEDALASDNYYVYHSQYISIRAAATDYKINDSPYVRLVVSLILDTEF